MRLKKPGGWLPSHINTLCHCKLFTRHMEAGRAPRWDALIRGMMIPPWPGFLGAWRAVCRGVEGGFFLPLSTPLLRRLRQEPKVHSWDLEATPTQGSLSVTRALGFGLSDSSPFSAPSLLPDLCVVCSLPGLRSLLFLSIL